MDDTEDQFNYDDSVNTAVVQDVNPDWADGMPSVPTTPTGQTFGPILNQEGGVYDYYHIEPAYDVDPGVIELPPCAATGDVAFPQVKRRTIRLTLTYEASRVGAPPVVPTITLTGDCGPVLLKPTQIMPGMQELVPGGAIKYNVAGQYTYGFKKPDLVQFNAAIAPWSRDLEAMDGDTSLFSVDPLDLSAGGAVGNVTDDVFTVNATTSANEGGQTNPFTSDGSGSVLVGGPTAGP